MEKRLILFLVLSAAIFIGWSRFFAPQPETPRPGDKAALTTPSPSASVAVTPESPKQPSPALSTPPATQAEPRQIKVKTDYWVATLSNKGGVVTDWTMIKFSYANNGVEATKSITFKGKGENNSSGFDFDFVGSVRRNGSPVQGTYVVIGPNFGDQSVKEISTYKHAPQLTYAVTDGGVKRKTADSLKGGAPQTPVDVTWAAVDDNYFAMAFVPSQPALAVGILNDKYVSVAVSFHNGEVNHVYACPKDLSLLSQVSGDFGISNKTPLDDIVSYGILDFVSMIINPIAQFMLKALRAINHVTHNFGWSIVILTVALNMLFFPLRWRSSVIMKRAAAMAPRMKDVQERMKKLDKNDPRMLDLQKEQIALMKEGNPLMGCLPLLLQMPFFIA